MGRSSETFSKKEREKKKQKKKEEKRKRREERKNQTATPQEMIAYVNADGVIVDTPPDPNAKKPKIKAEDIEISVPKKEEIDSVRKGIIIHFNEDRGYGFIKDLNDQEEFFFHVNNVKEPVDERDKVTFEIEKTPKGLSAVGVALLKEEEEKPEEESEEESKQESKEDSEASKG